MRLPNITPKERVVEAYLRDQIKKRGGVAYKFVSPATVGVPDRIVMMPGGGIWFVEVKRTPKDKLTKLQQIACDKIMNLGQKVRIVHGREGVDEFLGEVDFDAILS